MELNVFFMETELTEDFESIRDTYVSIIRKVKETVSIPVIMKIGKNYSNIPSLVNLLKVNGADGVVLFNRFYQPDIDINNMQIVSGNVFSNHSDLSDTIRWTAIVSGKIPGISIASSTGVHDWDPRIQRRIAPLPDVCQERVCRLFTRRIGNEPGKDSGVCRGAG